MNKLLLFGYIVGGVLSFNWLINMVKKYSILNIFTSIFIVFTIISLITLIYKSRGYNG